jgi:hypothetical protein
MKQPHLMLAPVLLALAAASPTALAAPSARAPVERKAQELLDQWKRRFDREGFSYTVAGPFVIAGDGSPAQIARYRDRTILAAARALRATYFDRQPAEPVLILLFESREPYARLAKEWFGDEDVPHYGFFRRKQNVMLMNVGTGTGTLVHELVHALIAPDFPGVPDWFNEGLASLYEQCSLDGERITGHENWRLPALQKAIRAGTLRPLRELVGDEHFYDSRRVGMNYAQARYLLMYLQEKGMLDDYYVRFRARAEQDATGIKTLEELVGPQGLERFETEWKRWVIELRFG